MEKARLVITTIVCHRGICILKVPFWHVKDRWTARELAVKAAKHCCSALAQGPDTHLLYCRLDTT